MPSNDRNEHGFAGQTCGIYPRVSSRKQAKQGKTSLDDQELACRDYATELGILVEEACVKPEAYTSTQMSRPELNQLLHEMQAHRVPNLIIDTVDRMTRQGQLAASIFLNQFVAAHITLHVVSMDLVVRDDKGVKDFLDAAYQAQQDNLQRVRKIKRSKRSRARKGIYLRGNRAPYGFRHVACAWDAEGNVTERRLEPDERAYSDLGFPTLFAPHPYAARRKMLERYADGMSCQSISNLLTAEGVLTSGFLQHRTGANRWCERTVRYLVVNPLNDGELYNFRHTYTVKDPDDKHNEEWVQAHPVPLEAQVRVLPEHGAPAPLLDPSLAARYAVRRANRRTLRPARPGAAPAGPALLAGGLAVCARCGKSLSVHSFRRRITKTYQYYICRQHIQVPTACQGVSFPVPTLDAAAWFEVLAALVSLGEDNDSYLDKLTSQQAELDYSGMAGGGTVEDLRAARAYFAGQVILLTDDLAHLTTATGRDTIREQINRFGVELDKADRQLAALERQANRVAERRQVLNDYLYQWELYSRLVLSLDPYKPQDIPVMAEIMRLVGARVRVGKGANGDYEIAVELLITPAAAQPWFSRAELLDTLPTDVIGSTTVPARERLKAEHRPLPPPSSSL